MNSTEKLIHRIEAEKRLLENGPEVSQPDEKGNITITWGCEEFGCSIVKFTLLDLHDETEKCYDLEITIENGETVGPIVMMQQTLRCMNQFYELGLNAKFGRITGDEGGFLA